MIRLTYLEQPPSVYTFEMPKVKLWVESVCVGKTLNLFARKILLDIDEYRVDIDRNANANKYCDAYEFISRWDGELFSTVLLDPPYNLRKSREKYGGRYIGSFTKIKNYIPSIIKHGGKVVTFGYDTVGMSKKRGFTKTDILVVCHGGDHNDTLAVVERYVQPHLFLT
jgi:hypothetical protein